MEHPEYPLYKTISGEWLLTETTALHGLTIKPGAKITAPEGKLVTMTFNGVGVEPAPGVYEGEIVLTVTDRIPLGTYPFRAGVCVMDGRYVPEMSVSAIVQGGERTESSLSGASITSREENFNGFYFGGKGEYALSDISIDFEGNGGNDFVGFGAGMFIGDEAKVTIDRAKIHTRGAARGTMFLAGNCDVTVNDSELVGRNGVLPHDYIETVTPGVMRTVPWMLSLHGNCRAFNLAESATAHFNHCTMKSEGWGVMSTDGVRKGYLYMTDCDVEITGTSGYGAFSINDCLVSYDSCRVKVPVVGLIVANGKASGIFTGNTQIDSGRFAAMFFRNTDGKLRIDPDVKIRTAESVFMIKGCTPQIEVTGADLQSAEGTILTLMDLDDPNDTGAWLEDPKEPDVKDPSRDLTTAVPGEDAIARFSDMHLNGNIYNCSTSRKYVMGVLDPDAPKAPSEPPYSGGPGTHGSQKKAGGPGGPGDAPAGGPGAPGGAPAGGPGGPGGKPGEIPEMFKKLFAPPTAKNLAVYLSGTQLTGAVTCSQARHRVERITKYNREELGALIQTPAPAVNNGVSVILDAFSSWTVTETCYLTRLEAASGAVLQAPEGRTLTITADGQTVVPGADGLQLTGDIVLTVA